MSVPETFAITDAVQLAVVERSGFIESRHAGIAIVLAPDGTVLRSLGKTDALIFPRSSLKPFLGAFTLFAVAVVMLPPP